MAKISVALLGLGTMGSGMATNPLKSGFPLTVYNRTAAKAEPFAKLGARIETKAASRATQAPAPRSKVLSSHFW
jgi:3-hydroxyisobutyrate dehydrogenase